MLLGAHDKLECLSPPSQFSVLSLFPFRITTVCPPNPSASPISALPTHPLRSSVEAIEEKVSLMMRNRKKAILDTSKPNSKIRTQLETDGHYMKYCMKHWVPMPKRQVLQVAIIKQIYRYMRSSSSCYTLRRFVRLREIQNLW